MNTEPVSPVTIESTRKTGASIESEILRRLAEVTQDRAADFMGVSASTVSRLRDDITKVAHLMAALGLQVASLDSMVISQDELNGLKLLAYKYLQTTIEKDRRG